MLNFPKSTNPLRFGTGLVIGSQIVLTNPMRGKKGKHYHAKSASSGERNGREERSMVRVYYKTVNHRHPVQHWVLLRYKNRNDE